MRRSGKYSSEIIDILTIKITKQITVRVVYFLDRFVGVGPGVGGELTKLFFQGVGSKGKVFLWR